MKLELKHLVGYLPYGLTGISKEENLGIEIVKGFSTYGKDNIINIITNVDDIDLIMFKPILRPLSDLTKKIEVNGEKFVPIDEIGKIHTIYYDIQSNTLSDNSIDFYDVKWMPYNVIQKLYEWHFDIHNLIENNLAIDKNTIL